MSTRITVKNNSSIRIEGEIELYDQSGAKFDLAGRAAISLCRCGLSKNKPFCDDSHKVSGFQSEVHARALPPPVPKP